LHENTEKKTAHNATKGKKEVHIVELAKGDSYLREIESPYESSHYYDVSISHDSTSWNIQLTLKAFDAKLKKTYHGKLFEDHIQEPRVFVALQDGTTVGWIELGYDKWNNRMRIWEFLVKDGRRRKGIGTLLMNHAAEIARQKQARMLVLETQTNNADAINFYLRFGFHFVGIDIAAYSNDDIAKKEVRLELGLEL
jgi:ribosomal protein S18 acetylase RimI-like enzyme